MFRAKAVAVSAGCLSVVAAAAWAQQAMFPARPKPSPYIQQGGASGSPQVAGQEQAMTYEQALARQQSGQAGLQAGAPAVPASAPQQPAATPDEAPIGVDPDGNPIFGAVTPQAPATAGHAENEAERAARIAATEPPPPTQMGNGSETGETIGGYPTQMPGYTQPQPSYQQSTPSYQQSTPSYQQPGTAQRAYSPAPQNGYGQPSYNQPGYAQPGYGTPDYGQRSYAQHAPSYGGAYAQSAPQLVQAPAAAMPYGMYPPPPPQPEIAYDYGYPYPPALGVGVAIGAYGGGYYGGFANPGYYGRRVYGRPGPYAPLVHGGYVSAHAVVPYVHGYAAGPRFAGPIGRPFASIARGGYGAGVHVAFAGSRGGGYDGFARGARGFGGGARGGSGRRR